MVYDIIVDRRSNYPEITTWVRNVRKDTEKEDKAIRRRQMTTLLPVMRTW